MAGIAKSIRVGVAGCGKIARLLHIPGYLRSQHANLVALYNHRRETVVDLLDAHPKVTLYTDYDQFLSTSGVEAISICTPNAMHSQMAIAALERGIHVLVEKPMAVSLKEASAMVEAASRNNAMLTVSFTQRHYPVHRKAKQIIDSGSLDRIIQIRTTIGHAGPLAWSPGSSWFVNPRMAGTGVIGDLCVHKADLIRYLTGLEVRSVAAFKLNFMLEDVEDNAVAVMRLNNSALATLSASWTTYGDSMDDVIIMGVGGTLRIRAEPGDPLVYYEASGQRISYPLPDGIPVSDDGSWDLGEVPAFIESIVGDRPNPAPGEAGYRALEICIAIEQSARTGEVIHLPQDVSSP